MRLLLLLFLLVGCEDKLNYQLEGVDSVFSGVEDIQPGIKYSGLTRVGDITKNSVTLYWSSHSAAKYYLIYQNGELVQFSQDLNYTVSGLKNNTEYTFRVRLLSESGVSDSNKNDITVRTLGSGYNSKSIELTGVETIKLDQSNKYLNKKFSISLWFKTNINQNGRRLFNFMAKDHLKATYAVELDNDKIVLVYSDNRCFQKKIPYDYDYANNQWHHLVGTYDGSTYKLYLNGNKVIENVDEFYGAGIVNAYIGSREGVNSSFFYSGKIDEFSIHKKALSDSEVSELYSLRNLNSFSSYDKIQLWLRMGDDSRDSIDKIYDQISGNVVTPLDFVGGSFVEDSP